MKYLVIILILFAVPAFAHSPGFYHHHDTVYVIDITPEPYEPEPIDVGMSDDEIRETINRMQRETDETNERIRSYLEDSED